MFACLHMSVCVCVFTYECVCVFVCLHMSVCVFACLHMSVCVCVRGLLWQCGLYAYMCERAYMYACISIRLFGMLGGGGCACVPVPMCMFGMRAFEVRSWQIYKTRT